MASEGTLDFAYITLFEIITVPYWRLDEILIDLVTFDDVIEVLTELNNKVFIEIFAHGNILQEVSPPSPS